MSETFKSPSQGRAGDEWAQIQGHKDAERVREPSDKLADFLNNATEESVDVTELDSVLSELAQTSPLPEGDAFDVEQGLRRFHQRLDAGSASEGGQAAETSFVSSSLPGSKKHRLPRVFLIAAVLTLVLATAASSARLNFVGRFTRWTEETFGFGTHETEFAEITKRPELAVNETREYETVQALCDDFGITAPLFPTWVPERFGNPTVVAMSAKRGVSFQIDYGNADVQLHILAYEITANLRDTERDPTSSDCESIHGIRYFFMSDDNPDRGFSLEKVAWQNGQFECRITGTTTGDEMKRIIYSIYEGE